MADFCYPWGTVEAYSGNVDIDGAPVVAMVIDKTQYTFNKLTDHHLSDIPSGAQLVASNPLTNKALTVVTDATLGAVPQWTADPAVTPPVPQGIPNGGAVVTFQNTGDPTTSPLLTYHDDDGSGNAISLVFNGSFYTIYWGTSASPQPIFKGA